MTRTRLRCALGLVVIIVVPGLGGCNDPSTDLVERNATTAISTIDEWCDLIDEVEALFEVADDRSVPFSTRQRRYQHIQFLFDELDSGAFVLDAESRPAVLADLDFGNEIATAWAAAPDEAEANGALARIVQGPLVAEGVAARIYVCEVRE